MSNAIEMTAYRVMAETGLSARELAEMDMDAYARASGRPTPAQAALQALGTQQPPQAPQSAPEAPQALESEPVDIASMDWATYAQFRQEAGIGVGRQEGRGIFNSVGSRSPEYRSAARAQAGRTG